MRNLHSNWRIFKRVLFHFACPRTHHGAPLTRSQLKCMKKQAKKRKERTGSGPRGSVNVKRRKTDTGTDRYSARARRSIEKEITKLAAGGSPLRIYSKVMEPFVSHIHMHAYIYSPLSVQFVTYGHLHHKYLHSKVQATLVEAMLSITKKLDSTLEQLYDQTEQLILSHTLRYKVLQQSLLQGVNHTISSRKRNQQQIVFPAGTTLLSSESEVSDLVQVMVDRDMDCYKRQCKGMFWFHGMPSFNLPTCLIHICWPNTLRLI